MLCLGNWKAYMFTQPNHIVGTWYQKLLKGGLGDKDSR